ncbi:GNAT family N-acetyltransferase [Candidatus Micrarchaeota archaeon]|nr:GNAT family N-acetyltransferase [Candidatus Micrarchaeota archaeon]
MMFKGLEIRPPKKSDSIKAYLDFISELIDENAFLLINKKPTMKEQKVWFKERLSNVKKGKEILLCVWDGERHAGNCSAKKEMWKNDQNVEIGLALRKEYRGKGLGEKLLREIIELARKKFKPKNIYLRVFDENKIAQNLYHKIGFREIARFPNWVLHDGKYQDAVYMLLVDKSRGVT